MMAGQQFAWLVEGTQHEGDVIVAIVVEKQRSSARRAKASRRNTGGAIAGGHLAPLDFVSLQPDKRCENAAHGASAHAAVTMMHIASGAGDPK
jgi:hypothetical protein